MSETTSTSINGMLRGKGVNCKVRHHTPTRYAHDRLWMGSIAKALRSVLTNSGRACSGVVVKSLRRFRLLLCSALPLVLFVLNDRFAI